VVKKVKEFIWKNIRVLLVCISVIFFTVIFHLLLNDEIRVFDEKIYSFFEPIISDKITVIFRIITETGGAISLIVLTIIIIIWQKDLITKIAIPLNLILATGLNLLIKELVERPRPTLINLIQETGYSFPSGHAMVNTAFYGFLIFLIYTNVLEKKKRNILCILVALLILGICSSRIYLGVHYASDVFAGACISIAYLCIFTKIYKEVKEIKETKNKED